MKHDSTYVISFGTENNDERYWMQQEGYLSFIVSQQQERIRIASLLQHEQWLRTAVTADRTEQLWLHSKSLDTFETRCSGRPTGCFGISLPSLGATKNVNILLIYWRYSPNQCQHHDVRDEWEIHEETKEIWCIIPLPLCKE